MSTDSDDLEARVAELETRVESQRRVIAGILNLFQMMRDVDRARRAGHDDFLNLFADED